ncbi:hypothetical protein [Dehalobacterium formicoaceticum]|uniref:hypothetical protein n=1 Tax=Dehalobacterium formicoaceticum TaxID=51515 RepID=UPI000B7E2B8E|nr:hypothetical protein [Dehalobacterium formicoaceticum]
MSNKSIHKDALGSDELQLWRSIEDQIEAQNKKLIEAKLARKSLNYIETVKNPEDREAWDLLRALYLTGDDHREVREIKDVGVDNAAYHQDSQADQLGKMIQGNMLAAARADKKLKNKLVFAEIMLDKERKLILKKYPRTLNLRVEPTNSLVQEILETQDQRSELKKTNPDAYFAINALEYRNYIEEVQKGNLVQTAHVKICKARMLTNMNEGQATFIHGHLGGGKTELAIVTAKEYLMHKHAVQAADQAFVKWLKNNQNKTKEEKVNKYGNIYYHQVQEYKKAFESGDPEAVEKFTPLFISGSRNTSTQDLFIEKGLKLTKYDNKPILEHMEDLNREYGAWQEENHRALSKMSDKLRRQTEKAAARKILEIYKLKNQAFGTEIEKIEKEIYRGAKEGRPVIIDEINTIPNAVLISLNDVIQSSPGQTTYIPGGDRIVIADGFSITGTGNLSSNFVGYSGTHDFNEAFASRLDIFEYDYLPQTDEGNWDNQTDPEKNELFHIMIAVLADRSGALKLPEIDRYIDKLFKLAQLARTTQDVFSGKWKDSQAQATSSGDALEPRLERSVLSIRNVLRVLKQWNAGQEKDLDKALWEGFLSSITNPDDQSYIFSQALRFGFFQKNEGWNVQVKPVGSTLTGFDEIRSTEYRYRSKPEEIKTPREMIEILYGPMPARQIYPEITFDEPMGEKIEMDRYADFAGKMEELHLTEKALEKLSKDIS